MIEEIVLNSRQEAFKKAVLGRAGFFGSDCSRNFLCGSYLKQIILLCLLQFYFFLTVHSSINKSTIN
jgi:hypothetical protein